MKLVRQTTLYFRQGTSDKVYEVDLCDVGQDRFVVNFRYGKRGGSLREGSQTVSPLASAQAEKVFDDLVASKVKKGYSEGAPGPAGDPAPKAGAKPAPGAPVADPRAAAVLARLARGAKKKKGEWPIERAVWRAGELKLREAAPALLKLVGSGDALRDYCCAWALGWCGDDSAVSSLGRLYGDASTTDAVRRIAGEALLKLSDDATRDAFRSDMIDTLPLSMRHPARNGPADAFAFALDAHLESTRPDRYGVVDTLYLVDNEHVRPALLDFVRKAPLRPGPFQRLRHLFKAAEYRRDGQVFGLLAYRFETERQMYTVQYGSWATVHAEDGRGYSSANIDDAKGPKAKIAYGNRTRDYLRRRVWRTLRRMGELGDWGFVKMAVGVLLAYTDADAKPVKQTKVERWDSQARRSRTHVVQWDTFAPYYAFNHLLYEHSKRYRPSPSGFFWRVAQGHQAGEPDPPAREEAFPKLWEDTPVGLLHLLSESRCQPVHAFAAKALRACTGFLDQLDTDALLMLLDSPYEVTARLGFDVARSRMTGASPDMALVLAVATCASPEARAEAFRWIDRDRARYTADSALLVALVTSRHADARTFARELLGSAALPDRAALALVSRLISNLIRLGPEDGERAGDIAETIASVFAPQLRSVALAVALDLLAHPLAEVAGLGGRILLAHDLGPGDLPEGTLRSLVESPHAALRAVGVGLLERFPDEALVEGEDVLFALSTSPLDDVRAASRPIVARLAAGRHPDFARRFAARLVEALLAAETAEGVHRHVAGLLGESIAGWVDRADRALAMRLVESSSPAAEDLGALLVTRHLDAWAAGFETDDIVRLAGHEVKALREVARAVFARLTPRYHARTSADAHREIAALVGVLDVEWEDVREAWFETFRTFFEPEDFTPEILVQICDSVREPVQQLGRELLVRRFTEDAGQTYMLRLSEHPSASMQLFVTNYLERFAAGDAARLQALAPYFTRALSLVNRGGVAKKRIFAFLADEGQSSEAAARVVADILARQSATMAVGDRAAALEALVKIHRRFPAVPVPITVKAPEVRARAL